MPIRRQDMKLFDLPRWAACLAIGSAMTPLETAVGQSIGCARMPSTIGQYFGYGYGAGHHAPIVRTPGYRPERVARLTVVRPAEGALYAAPYGPGGCQHGQCHGSGTIDGGFGYGPMQPRVPGPEYYDPAAASGLLPLPPVENAAGAAPSMAPQPPVPQYNAAFPRTADRPVWR